MQFPAQRTHILGDDNVEHSFPALIRTEALDCGWELLKVIKLASIIRMGFAIRVYMCMFE